MSQDVLDYDHVLTACFTEDRSTPVIPDRTASNDGITDYALPAAFIMLVVSIFALGYVIVKKRK